VKEYKETYELYQVPQVFKDDWMNSYWDFLSSRENNEGYKDDYRFVYMGKFNYIHF
jgi:hypothetical protein